jgi:hypothetical protein
MRSQLTIKQRFYMVMRQIPQVSMCTDLGYDVVEGNVGGVVAGLVNSDVMKSLQVKKNGETEGKNQSFNMYVTW